MLFGLIATVMMSVSGFANSEIIKTEKSIFVENCDNKFKATFDLGDLTNLSESEINTLCENFTNQIKNLKDFTECTISYSGTVNVMGSSISISVSATAATCEEAGKMARRGLASEMAAAKKMLSIF